MTGDPAPTQRAWSPGVVHAVLALGGFAIGTTEFATMSLLPAFSKGMGVDAPPAATSSAPMRWAWWWGRRCSRCSAPR